MFRQVVNVLIYKEYFVYCREVVFKIDLFASFFILIINGGKRGGCNMDSKVKTLFCLRCEYLVFDTSHHPNILVFTSVFRISCRYNTQAATVEFVYIIC